MTARSHCWRGAAARVATVCLVATTMGGCATRGDEQAVTALVERLMGLMAEGAVATDARMLSDLFFGLDDLPSESLPSGLAPAAGIRSHTVTALRILPLGRAAIRVEVRADSARGSLELRARKVRGQWRLDPSIRFRQRLDEIRRVAP